MRIATPLLLATLAACATTQSPPPAASPHVAKADAKPERFDDKIRQDFFDGIRGDAAALDRAQKLCEDTLAQHPDQPEALVWHGAAITARSNLAFRSGDRDKAMELYAKGTGEMDRAVSLAPTSVAVRIPRGAVYLAMAHFVPQPEQTKLVQEGVSDYEATLAVQTAYFKTLTLHSREQLLYGLTDGYAMLGNTDKARATYERMRKDAAGSALLTRAAERAAGHEVAGNAPCEQCHAR
jgi:tetratricopeptide (TPR) repeat protein